MSDYKELRERTSRELGLANNHYDAIQKHLDAYEAAYAHELAERQRDRLAAGLRMPVFATVLCNNGRHEPMGVTHIIDGIDPECGGVNRPARETLEEIRQREPRRAKHG